MVDTTVVQEALEELAARLVVPVDMIAIHRDQPNDSDPGTARRAPQREYRSLRYGAFFLAYGPFEYFFNNIVGGHGGPGRDTPATADRIRDRIQRHVGVENVTRDWAARVRTAPAPDATTGMAPWLTLRTTRLGQYLRDARQLRHLLAHGGDPSKAPNEAETFYRLKSGGVSIRLPWVEGFIQGIEDLASRTALALAPDTVLPEWPEPPRTKVSGPSLPPRPY